MSFSDLALPPPGGPQLKRRDLLAATAAGRALGAITGSAGGADAPVGDRPLRVGLIGCGWYSQSDLLRLIQVAAVAVVSLCDVDSAMLSGAIELVASRQRSRQKPRGYRGYRDYREMLTERDLEVVLIATPDHGHALAMIAAVEAGADVYLQKPISIDIREGQGMLAAARKHPRVVQVGTQRRSTPHLIEARDTLLRLGRLGTIALVEICCCDNMRSHDAAPTRRRRPASTGRSGAVRRRRALTTASSSRAAGATSASTATASRATCASTCSTWCVGCSAWAGPGASPRAVASWSTPPAGRTSATPRARASPMVRCSWSGSTAHGAMRPLPHAPGRRPSTATRARSRPASWATTSPSHGGGAAIHRDVAYELDAYPEERDERDLEKHVAPAIRGHMRDFLAAVQARSRPVADIEQGYISTSS